MDASAFSSLSAVARSCLAMWGAQFFAHPLFRGNPKITLRIATAVIANAIVAVTHTRYFRFSPKIPFLFRTTFGVRLRSRLERIFCVLLRLSERSGTIEVHLATLSA